MRLIQGGGGTSLTAAQTTALAALTTDVVAAITGAASPSGANVFGTAAGIVSAAERAKITAIPTLTAPPAISGYTVTSGGGTTLTGTDIAAATGSPAKLRFSKPAEGTDHVGRAEKNRGSLTSIVARITVRGHASAFAAYGVHFRESATGKIACFGVSGGGSASGLYTRGFIGTADTTLTATFGTHTPIQFGSPGVPFWIRLDYAAAALTGYIWPGADRPTSSDWIQVASQTAAWCTTAGDKTGFFVLAPTGASEVGVFDIDCYEES